jgi:hypothetical protein
MQHNPSTLQSQIEFHDHEFYFSPSFPNYYTLANHVFLLFET